MESIIVVKIGGSTFGGGDTAIEDMASLQKAGKRLVVVHGGGNVTSRWLERLAIPTRFVRGERVTDAATLEVVTAVLAGLVNKEIVAAINSLGGQAIGISGVDGALIQSRMKDRDMGYVGMVVRVNPAPLEMLLSGGFMPVVSPVSLHSVDLPDDAPRIINVNGDPVAGEIAAALHAERLVFLTDVAGISDGSGRVIDRLSADEAESLVTSGVASGGMVPKINACLRALSGSTAAYIIDGRQPHALTRGLEGQGGGTTIYK